MNWLKAVLGSIALIAVCAVCYLGYSVWTRHQRDVKAQGDVVTAGGVVHTQTVAGHDAVQAVQAEAATEAHIKDITQQNAAAVAAAPTAETPFDPALYQVALRGHCRRAPGDPACASLRHRGS